MYTIHFFSLKIYYKPATQNVPRLIPRLSPPHDDDVHHHCAGGEPGNEAKTCLNDTTDYAILLYKATQDVYSQYHLVYVFEQAPTTRVFISRHRSTVYQLIQDFHQT